jgi:hypothetical protein
VTAQPISTNGTLVGTYPTDVPFVAHERDR